MRLDELTRGQTAIVISIECDDHAMEAKLREVGFAEDDEVELLHFGPVGGKPICVRLNQTMVALRHNEAAAIQVELTK